MSHDSPENPYTPPQAYDDEAEVVGKYRTAPPATDKLPGGIPYIVGNEAAERFSFYGMKGILFVFMTKYLLDASGDEDFMSANQANFYIHIFTSSAYFFPILGSVLADRFLGKYRTILLLSIVYCLGHLALAINDTFLGLSIGLTLIAIGSGGIKPCVSAHVGDQFGARNRHLISRVFSWFYFSINLGAFLSIALTPWLLLNFGPQVAFGLPGVLMFVATVLFWSGRHKFVHIPPAEKSFFKETFSSQGLKVILHLSILYVFVAAFWSLFDQTGSSWIAQANKMDLRLPFGYEILPSQVQSANPVFILIGIPLFSYLIYPAIDKYFPLTPLRKIGIGFFLAAASFAITALIETRLAVGFKPHFLWQILALVVLTSAEIMVSITCLEFSYTQAPKKMKSFIMGLFLLSVSAGNLLTALVNHFIQDEQGNSIISNVTYFWSFTVGMLIAAVLFVGVSQFYRGQTYIQDEAA